MAELPEPPRQVEPILAVVGGPLALLLAIGLMAAWMARPREQPKAVAPIPVSPPAALAAETPPPEPIVVEFVGPPRPTFDDAVIEQAEAERNRAAAALASAEDDVRGTAEALAEAEKEAAERAAEAQLVDDRVRLPRSKIATISARLEDMKRTRDRLADAVHQLEGQPPPRRPLGDDAAGTKSPVARAVDGEEIHFEIRGDRVTFLDLDRLIKLAENDARLRLRMGTSLRSFAATVGPVGAFSMKYELGRSPIAAINDLLDPGSGGGAYTMLGFEVVPVQRVRGETIDAAVRPASEFARVINRLSPSRTTITLWIYPDGFAMYRQVRQLLVQRGFFVAARPLPDTIPIRGSPGGSRSAAQ